MKYHIEFRSPGTFLAESNEMTIWVKTREEAIHKALEESKKIVQRHNATPYCFLMNGTLYYLPHCEITLVKDIPERIDDGLDNQILLANCRINGWKAIVTSMKGWKFTQPFGKNSVLLSEDGRIKVIGAKL